MKRYEPAQRGFVVLRMEEDPEGTYVKYSDVEGLIEALRFYAKEESWGSIHPYDDTEKKVICLSDIADAKSMFDLLSFPTAGLKAREALKKAGIE